MIRKNAKGSILQSAISITILFLVYYMFSRTYGSEYIGYYTYFAAFFSFFNLFSSGIAAVLVRYLPSLNPISEKVKIHSYLKQAISLNILINIVLLLLLALCYNIILRSYFNFEGIESTRVIFYFFGISSLMINSFNIIFLSFFDGLQLIHVRNRIVITSTLCLLIIACFPYFFVLPSSFIFLAFIVQSIIQFLYYCFVLYQDDFKYSFSIRGVDSKVSFKYSSKTMLLNGTIFLSDIVLRYFIANKISVAYVGFFDVVNRISIQIKSLFTLILYPFVPKISATSASKKLNISNYKDILTITNFVLKLNNLLHLALFFFEIILAYLFFDEIIFYQNVILISTLIFVNLIGVSFLPFYYFNLAKGKLLILFYFHLIHLLILFCSYFGSDLFNDSYILIPSVLAIVFSSFFLFLRTKRLITSVIKNQISGIIWTAYVLFTLIIVWLFSFFKMPTWTLLLTSFFSLFLQIYFFPWRYYFQLIKGRQSAKSNFS